MTPDDVTVVIPLYNKSASIARAIESVSRQKKPPKEIIVVDDGSTDDGASIVEGMQETHSLLRLISQENRGVSAARNRGVEHAGTEWVCFLDADDEWLPEFTTNLMHLAKEAPDADFYSLGFIIDENGVKFHQRVDLEESFLGIVPDFIKRYSRGYGIIHSSTACIHKPFFTDLGGFPEGESSGEDIYLWLHAALNGIAAFYNKTSAVIHRDPMLGKERRERTVSYHFRYFSDNLSAVPAEKRGDLKNFLLNNLFIKWSASKLDRNRWQRDQLRSICRKISLPHYFLLSFAELFPRSMFSAIQVWRQKGSLG